MSGADFLVEIGTEELPPKALRALMDAFAASLERAVDEARLEHGTVRRYASPRRLAVVIENLALAQPERRSIQKGPPVRIAFDDEGKPTAAAQAFAKKCGVSIDDLQRQETPKGEWLVCDVVAVGQPASALLPALIETALQALPIPRRMRWADQDTEFVRPVHWVVLLHGDEVIDAEIMNIRAGRTSQGHRFMSAGDVRIDSPAAYLETLRHDGAVIADFDERLDLIRDGVAGLAAAAGGQPVQPELLYDEVAALVEWPVPLTGKFDAAFLDLPPEVIVSTLTGHQRYFPVADTDGKLLPVFITVANLKSQDPDQVRDGNERVIRPRLADAAFFWDSDQRLTLEDQEAALQNVVYQQGLGSLFDKSARVVELAGEISDGLGNKPTTATAAARFSKCDLVTGMVGEFPELQGVMGGYYARAQGQDAAIAQAIAEHYQPRFAGDALPASRPGQVVALADRLDSLAGIFVLGKKPSGNRDPFGLRRSALAVVRLLIEADLDLDLPALVNSAVAKQPAEPADTDTAEAMLTFIMERLRHYFLDADPSLSTEVFDAVLARAPHSLPDFAARLDAVRSFVSMEAAESLAAANKRTANILRKAEGQRDAGVDTRLLCDTAEQQLHAALQQAQQTVKPLLERRDYTAALSTLSELREPVDRFFDDVMVMADDTAVRNNRLNLLQDLRALFLEVADISRLSASS